MIRLMRIAHPSRRIGPPQSGGQKVARRVTSGSRSTLIRALKVRQILCASPHWSVSRHTNASLHESLNFERYAVCLCLSNKLAIDLEDAQFHQVFYFKVR